jgi:hypothetical protein
MGEGQLMTHSELPGAQWFGWLHNATLRLGVLVGAYLSVIMLVSLVLANRVPLLEPFANFRNAFCFGVFAFAASLPLLRCRDSATRLFVSGATGWMIFSWMYWLAGSLFVRLHSRFHRPLQVFLIGAILYGLASVAVWVAGMVRHARTQPMGASRRRPY